MEFAYTLAKLETQSNINIRAGLAASAATLAAGGFGQKLIALAMVGSADRPAEAEDKTPKMSPLANFARLLKDKSPALSPEKLNQLLEQDPPQKPLLKEK